MSIDAIKKILWVILIFLIIMICVSYFANKGEEQVEEETDVVEGSFIDENELYIINQVDVYDYFDNYDNAELCMSKVTGELVRYGSNLKVAKLTNIECSGGVLVFDIVNADVENNVQDAFKVTVSKEGTAIERLS